jgi:preprotein translocase subunit SecD
VASILTDRLRHVGATEITAVVVGHDVRVSGRAPDGAVEKDLSVVGETRVVSLRPVECGALPYTPAAGVAAPATTSPLPVCGPRYDTTRANLAVTPDPNVPAGYTDRTVPPDPAFTSYPSTTPAEADSHSSGTVLLPTAPGVGDLAYPRFVLGPAAFTGSDITGARVVKVGGHWVVDVTFTPTAAVRWDAFAHENFHQMISVDLDGAVLSAPLIQAKQRAFSSADGQLQLPGPSTSRQARALASILGNDAMPVSLVRVSQTVVGPGLHPGGEG